MSAQRSAAPTVVTDNREQPVRNTDGATKKRSNPTPEQGGNGGGQLPPTTMHGAGDPDPDDGDDDDDDGQDLKGGTSRRDKGKERERQDPEREDEEEDVVDVMARAIARERLLHTKRPSDPRWVFKNKSHQDIRIWLMAVQDFFERNSHQWTMETDRIKYAMGRMEGDDIAPFTDTYRKKMSGALGYAKEIGYERWFMFEQKVTERFAPTHEAERTHKLMKLERYHGDIRQFLLRMENHNIKVGLQGVAWRDMLKAQMPEAGLLRLSFETYPNDELWLAGFKNAMIQHENQEEDKRLRHGKGKSSGTSISRKTDDRTSTKSNPRPPKRYTVEKRAAYKEKHKVPRTKAWSKEKTATDKKEVVHTHWDKAHDTIPKDVRDRRRNNKACTPCGMTNHFWKHCRKEQSVATFGTKRYESNKRKRDQPQAQRKRVAVVAERSQGESSRIVNRIDRPLAWSMYDGEEL